MTATSVAIRLPHLNLTLLREQNDPLAQLNMYGLSIDVNKLRSGKTVVAVILKEIDAHDLRSESESLFKNIIDTRPQNSNHKGMIAICTHHCNISIDKDTFVTVTVEDDAELNEVHVKVIAGDPRVIFEPGVVMEIVHFAVKRFPDHHEFLTNKKMLEEIESQQQKTVKVQCEVGKPSFVVPVDALSKDSRFLVVTLSSQFSMEMRPSTGYESFHVGVVGLMAYMEHPDAVAGMTAPILEPMAIAVHVETTPHTPDATKIERKIKVK